MLDTTTALLVALFFVHAAAASLAAGALLFPKKDPAVKFFGLGLILSSIAFATWAMLAANRLDNIRILAGLAAVFLILSLFAFFIAGIQHLQAAASYRAALFIGAVAAVGLFVLRTSVYPAHLLVTPGGFLVFELQTPVQVAYIAAITASILPAAGAVAGKFKKSFVAPLINGCFTALAIGGIILVTSADTDLILLDGIAMTIAFLLLWTTLLFGGRKALDKVD